MKQHPLARVFTDFEAAVLQNCCSQFAPKGNPLSNQPSICFRFTAWPLSLKRTAMGRASLP
jgi:hypothetical protein